MTVSLTTDFPSDDDYYILDGQWVLLECVFTSALQTTWKLDQIVVLVYALSTGSTDINANYVNKVTQSEYSSGTHKVSLHIDKTTDEGISVTCAAIISPAIPAELGIKDLVNILGKCLAALKLYHQLVVPQVLTELDLLCAELLSVILLYVLNFPLHNFGLCNLYIFIRFTIIF